MRCAGQDSAEAGIVPEGGSSRPTSRCQVPRGRASRGCPRVPCERSVSTCDLACVLCRCVCGGIVCRYEGSAKCRTFSLCTSLDSPVQQPGIRNFGVWLCEFVHSTCLCQRVLGPPHQVIDVSEMTSAGSTSHAGCYSSANEFPWNVPKHVL